MTVAYTLRLLERAKPALTPQQYRTLQGQIKAGDPDGAVRGMQKLLCKRRRHNDKA